MSMPDQFTMPSTEYGGDEVSAIVLDPGYSTTRAGFAGEDQPKSVVPTHYIRRINDNKVIFGENALHDYDLASKAEVCNPLVGGGAEDWVADWDVASNLWEHAITSRLTGPRKRSTKIRGPDQDGDVEMGDDINDNNSKQQKEHQDYDDEGGDNNPFAQHPLLMTEPGKSSAKTREKILTTAMEDWEFPAFFLAKTGMLSAFFQGRIVALVVDVGGSMISVTPVYEGMVLKKGVRTSPLGGNFVTQQARMFFQQSQTPLMPRYTVVSKQPVESNQPAQAVYRQFAADQHPATDSFRRYHEDLVLHDFKESVVEYWVGPGKLADSAAAAAADAQPAKSYELPDGWNTTFNIQDRRRIAEGVFDHQAAFTDAAHPAPPPEHTVIELIKSSLEAVDEDPRTALLQAIVVVGAASFQRCFTRRLDAEIRAAYPSPNVRMMSSTQYIERAFSSWVGGSILGSLGTFHQMWISRKEYDEHGPSIIEKRCK